MPLTEYCDANHLSTRERLDLFTQVCHAVHHAHEKGIVHRDIKPSNVMVTLHDGTPVPKIIDFGVAKATNQRLTEKTLFTAYGACIGTPTYMSPEQAEMSGLDVDRRSDVYSLGILLYELLTGTTPLDGDRLRTAAYDELLRLIREQEPPIPSARLSTLGGQLNEVARNRHAEPHTLTKLVRGELDWIVMKAIEKDRRRRYASAADLVTDVGRYFSSEPVTARRRSPWYRAQKFVRRSSAPLTAAAAIFAALVIGGALVQFGGLGAAPGTPTQSAGTTLDEPFARWLSITMPMVPHGRAGGRVGLTVTIRGMDDMSWAISPTRACSSCSRSKGETSRHSPRRTWIRVIGCSAPACHPTAA